MHAVSSSGVYLITCDHEGCERRALWDDKPKTGWTEIFVPFNGEFLKVDYAVHYCPRHAPQREEAGRAE